MYVMPLCVKENDSMTIGYNDAEGFARLGW